MTTTQAWAADIRRTRHIGDFRQWENHQDYEKALSRLLRGLKADPQWREVGASRTPRTFLTQQ